MTKPLISIVVILKQTCEFNITHTFPAIYKQSYKNWELLILPDSASTFHGRNTRVIPTFPKLGPADKKDLGIENSKGEIVAFIDDDAYPDKDWLLNAMNRFNVNNAEVAAVCGPGVTPPSDALPNQVSGWFWASPLGSGGAGTYRCWPGKVREVDDYPTFNLIVKKDDLQAIGGFDSAYWPGEDTKLCHDLIYKLNKKIIYDPSVLVYHCRRPILIPHLKQLGRYGLHRGYFARHLPKTSRRIGYILPAIFTVGVVGGLVLLTLAPWLINNNNVITILVWMYVSCLAIYLVADFFNSLWVFITTKNIKIAALLIPTTLVSHLFYGLMFIRGFFKKGLTSKYGRDKL